MTDRRKIALLIDADNTQFTKLESVINTLSQQGELCIRRAYGNWSKPHLNAWHKPLNKYSIKAVQQFDYAIDKNATDMALLIDAMDLLYSSPCDTFAIVSSDSDFTPLAIRLREAGKRVLGFGRQQTPEAFRNSCAGFHYLDEPAAPASTAAPECPNAPQADAATGQQAASEPQQQASKPYHELSSELLFAELEDFARSYATTKDGADGFVPLTHAGTYLHSKHDKPQFRLKYAEHTKLLPFLEAHPERYKIRKEGEETSQCISYRCLKKETPAPAVPLERVHDWLRRICNESNDPEKFATVGHTGAHLHRFAREVGTEFNVKQYGHSKLINLLKNYPERYEIRETNRNGSVIYAYRCQE